MAIAKPEVMATQLVPATALFAASCANATGAKRQIATADIRNHAYLFICFSCYEIAAKRWLPSSSSSRDHIERRYCQSEFVILRVSSRDVNHGQNCEHESRQNGDKNVQHNKC